MVKTFILLSLTALTLFAADQTEERGSYRFQPCDSWWMGSGGRYECTFLGMWITVPTINEIDRLNKTIELQEEKIAKLEERLAKLEAN